MTASTEEVVKTRLKSLWCGVEDVVDVEGVLFFRSSGDVVRAEANNALLGRPFMLREDTDPDEFLNWANAKVVNYTGRTESEDSEGVTA